MPWTVPCKQWLNTESSTDRISWSQTYNFQEGDISGIMFWLFDSANASFQKQLLYVHDKPSITSGLYLPVFLLGLLNTIVILLKPSTAQEILLYNIICKKSVQITVSHALFLVKNHANQPLNPSEWLSSNFSL